MTPICDVALDKDDVIVDFVSTAVDRLNEKYSTSVRKSDFRVFGDMPSHFGIPNQQFLDDIVSLNILEDSKPYEGVPDRISKLKDAGARVTIVTSRGYHPKAREITERVLDRSGIPYDRLHIVGFRQKKSDFFNFPVDIFVDDSIKNHRDMISKGVSRKNVVIETSWNCPKVNDISDIEDRILYSRSLNDLIDGILV